VQVVLDEEVALRGAALLAAGVQNATPPSLNPGATA
jgi:hypothetical protein